MAEKKDIVKTLSKRELKDHGRNAIIAALAGLPVVGGPLSSLLSEYIPNWKEKRVLDFIQELSDKLQEMADRIDEEYIKSEEFAFLFEQTFLSVIKNYQKEKLVAYKGILVNSCTTSKLNTSEREYFLSLVERLETVHILVLSLFWDPENFAARYGVQAPEYVVTGSLQNTIMTLLRPFGFPEDLVTSAIRDLDNMGLLRGVADALKVMMTPSGATELRGRMSEIGRRFCEFITLE